LYLYIDQLQQTSSTKNNDTDIFYLLDWDLPVLGGTWCDNQWTWCLCEEGENKNKNFHFFFYCCEFVQKDGVAPLRFALFHSSLQHGVAVFGQHQRSAHYKFTKYVSHPDAASLDVLGDCPLSALPAMTTLDKW
jgi:hypothetical protein